MCLTLDAWFPMRAAGVDSSAPLVVARAGVSGPLPCEPQEGRASLSVLCNLRPSASSPV